MMPNIFGDLGLIQGGDFTPWNLEKRKLQTLFFKLIWKLCGGDKDLGIFV